MPSQFLFSLKLLPGICRGEVTAAQSIPSSISSSTNKNPAPTAAPTSRDSMWKIPEREDAFISEKEIGTPFLNETRGMRLRLRLRLRYHVYPYPWCIFRTRLL